MRIFKISESELKKMASGLEIRETELNNHEIDLKSAQSKLDHGKKLHEEEKAGLEDEKEAFREKVKTGHEAIASEKAELEKRRIEFSKLQAEANARYPEQLRESFSEVIEKRNAGLDARQQELDGRYRGLIEQSKELHTREGEVARRELAVTEREQKADAEFPEKTKALANEAARQHQANQAEADRLRKLAEAMAEDRQRVEVAKANLVQREQAIIAAEQKRDAGFADERAALDVELRDRRAKTESEIVDLQATQVSALEDEIAKLKTKRLEETTKAEQTERDRIRAEIAKERDAWTKEQEDARKKLEAARTELEKQKSALSAQQSNMEGCKVELEANERTLERKDQRLEQQWQKRNMHLNDAIEAGVEERRKSFETWEAESRAEINRLRDGLRIQTELVGAFEQLKRQLGDRDPAEILRDLNSKSDELKRLREELATRPTEEMRERYQALELEAKNQKARSEQLAQKIADNSAAVAEVADLRRKNSEFDAENKSLAQKATIFEGAANEAQAELNRLRAAYERPAEVEARYKEICLPHIKADKAKQPTKADIDEIIWLKGVGDDCEKHGLPFIPRILKAFHTALKTAEWSPLTVLAGVSGTGKSELPKLYSHFGGLLFEPLSVQPNWDSQESMLGFFNSIDNKFDAQPILRFLAQSQKKWIEKKDGQEGYPGLSDCVCMVLLDEMNLAHPELYFAEFLSKMELRRSYKGDDVPSLPVKIGAGLKPYDLPLGRNVLWTGTMNQDETTKSLSDKVLDRSIIIHFPRPTTLKRRLKQNTLDDENRGALLSRRAWQNWCVRDIKFEEDEIKQFKSFIEEINVALAGAGRAIGHRVWQSIEYYMANYPDVRDAQKKNDKEVLKEALHIAFEDQLVQKVMPKLRGIDTRGNGEKCLKQIRDIINVGIDNKRFNLEEDFNLACELGHGQFIWQSANYLNENERNTESAASNSISIIPEGEAEKPKSLETDLNLKDEPPLWFRPKESKRKERWAKTSKEEQDRLIAEYKKKK